jgi:hypothetical protein
MEKYPDDDILVYHFIGGDAVSDNDSQCSLGSNPGKSQTHLE